MSTKHTPGPWKVRYTGDVGTDAELLAAVYPIEVSRIEEHDANARLMAAAPDLLEALSELVNAVEDNDRDSLMELIAAHKAIAKATGGAA